MEMCRFTGSEDPNYRKVAGELRSIYLAIVELNAQRVHQEGRIRRSVSVASAAFSVAKPEAINDNELNESDKACLRSLWFPNMNVDPQNLEKPVEQTCLWLFNHQTYLDWFNGRDRNKYFGLLWLKGKPGAGKSILMKEAFRQAALGKAASDYLAAAFFYSAKGDELLHAPIGLFRSLLYQLLPGHPEHLRRFRTLWEERSLAIRDCPGRKTPLWPEMTLKSIFVSLFAEEPTKRTLIFIDALDECDADSVRSQAYFWREITKSAHTAGVNLNVCLSSRHFPSVTVSDCPEIIVENHNSEDIAIYVDYKFKLVIAAEEPDWEILRNLILEKSAGVFLWAVLVVDAVFKRWDEGKGLQFLIKELDVVPVELETLFSQMFSCLKPATRKLTVRLFQWAILAAKPLRLYEWHHILAFIREPTPSSLREWRVSDDFTKKDEQLERQINSISKGLIEVKTLVDEPQDKETGFESISQSARAGSLLEHGEARVVQVIHESVREFFLKNNGFSALDPSLESNPIGNGHLSIMSTCLDYLNIRELDALITARTRAQPKDSFAAPVNIPRPEWSAGGRSGASTPDHTPTPYRPQTHGSDDREDLCAASISQDCILLPSNPGRRRPKESLPTSNIQRQRWPQKTFEFELLKKLSVSAPKVDIDRWIEASHIFAGQMSWNTPGPSSTNVSATGQSETLEDYAALLSYATYELFTHAHMAEEHRVDPSPIIDRLMDKKTWARWAILKEDEPRGIELQQYAIDRGLKTWISVFSSRSTSIAPYSATESKQPVGHVFARPKKQQLKFFLGESSCDDSFSDDGSLGAGPSLAPHRKKLFRIEDSWSDDSHGDDGGFDTRASPAPEPRRSKRPRKQGSIGSFCSASSHTGNFPAPHASATKISSWDNTPKPTKPAPSSNDDESGGYMDESAIDDDDDDEEWEDSIEENAMSSTGDKVLFQRIDSNPNLPRRQSLITMMIEQSGRTKKLQNTGSHSSPAIQREGISYHGPGLADSADDSDDGLLMMKPSKRSTPLKPISTIPQSTTQPIVTTNRPKEPGSHSPRTTRRNMLSVELTEELRRHLLWERQQKSSTANAVLRRRHSTNDRVNMRQCPDQGAVSKGENKNGNWHEYFDGNDSNGYHTKGW